MRITRQTDDLRLEPKPIVLAVGSFDGVHKGHQAILRRATENARAAGGEPWVLTLDPHPMKILKPQAAPPLITSTQHKLRLMEPFGIDGCVVLPFTNELAAEAPEAFLHRLHDGIPSLKELIVGPNWTFGHKAKGTVALAQAIAGERGFEVTVVEPVEWNGSAISSTRIRQSVSDGRLADAEEMLGRPFSILGTVIHGRQVGRQMGFPTANLDPHNEVRPPSGIYAVRVDVSGRLYDGAGFLADSEHLKTSPSGFVLETYLFDFDHDLYGRDIEVFFRKFIREVRAFPSRAQLQKQIALDVKTIREALSV